MTLQWLYSEPVVSSVTLVWLYRAGVFPIDAPAPRVLYYCGIRMNALADAAMSWPTKQPFIMPHAASDCRNCMVAGLNWNLTFTTSDNFFPICCATRHSYVAALLAAARPRAGSAPRRQASFLTNLVWIHQIWMTFPADSNILNYDKSEWILIRSDNAKRLTILNNNNKQPTKYIFPIIDYHHMSDDTYFVSVILWK